MLKTKTGHILKKCGILSLFCYFINIFSQLFFYNYLKISRVSNDRVPSPLFPVSRGLALGRSGSLPFCGVTVLLPEVAFHFGVQVEGPAVVDTVVLSPGPPLQGRCIYPCLLGKPAINGPQLPLSPRNFFLCRELAQPSLCLFLGGGSYRWLADTGTTNPGSQVLAQLWRIIPTPKAF